MSFAVSLASGYVTLRLEHLHGHVTGDIALAGSHKVHRRSVTRIGGLSVFAGWVVGLLASAVAGMLSWPTALAWLACLAPAFVGGFAEDLTKRVSPVMRLLACFIAAGLAYYLLNASVSRIDIGLLDQLLTAQLVAFAFTCFAVGGVAHAINIIDGLNGLASGVCLIALLALGYVAFQVNDPEILLLCGLATGAVIGFRVWNYPSGRMFCGDGGAYFLGALVAIISALLVKRHGEVSAWFPLLLVLYPVWETLFSAYRRRILRGRPASSADKLHMHTLFYKRVKLPMQDGKPRTRRNSDASVSMILFACGSALPAVLWWDEGSYLIAAALAYILLYLVIYRRLVRFGASRKSRLPRWSPEHMLRRVAAMHRADASRKTVREANKLH